MPDIETVKKEYQELLEQLSDPGLISDWERFEELSKKKKSLEKTIEKEDALKDIQKKMEENKAIIASQEDQELSSVAEEENSQLKEKEKQLQAELEQFLKSDQQDSKEPKAVIVEIRAGAGGEESALFASDLFKMYSKYGQTKSWSQKVLDSRPTGIGGLKEIIFELSGDKVFYSMKNEAGVHRVQRIPETEKSGRIHTSTASVAVLPKPRKEEIKIRPEDLRIDTFRASGPGGQYVNRRETAVRITHLPTGLVVASQTERNQLQNKENALSILAARILEKKEQAQAKELGGERKTQIGKAQRAEKIRTYNFPQDRVTDHRVKKSWSNIESIMAGRLDPIIEKLSQSL